MCTLFPGEKYCDLFGFIPSVSVSVDILVLYFCIMIMNYLIDIMLIVDAIMLHKALSLSIYLSVVFP